VCIFSTLILRNWSSKFRPHSPFSISKFCSPLPLSLHSSSRTFKLLSMASYGGELVLETSSPWSGISNHLSSFSILLSLILKKQMIPLMKKIQGLQALHEATLTFVLSWVPYGNCKGSNIWFPQAKIFMIRGPTFVLML